MQLIRQCTLIGSAGLAFGCGGGEGLEIASPSPPNVDDASRTSGPAAGTTGTSGEGPGLGDGSSSSGVDPTGPDAETGAGRTLVPLGATWHVSAAQEPNWNRPEFDDSGWARLEAPMGRGYTDVAPWDTQGSLFARVSFEASFDADEVLELRVQRDDGARAYLDGELVGAWNVAGGIPEDEVTGVDGYTFFIAQPSVPASELQTHVLAVEVTQRTDPDLVFAARLRRLDAGAREDVLVQVRTRSRGGQYAPDNVGAFWIETPEGAFVRTLAVWAGTRREHLLQWNAASNGDDVDAVTSATAGSHHSRLLSWDHTDGAGSVLPRGRYVLRGEFTEDNSNEGEPAGPNLALAFATDDRCSTASATESYFADVTVAIPCG